jgi:dihydrofolate reductase
MQDYSSISMTTTERKPIRIIVACSENRVIGANGRLPWRIREDLRHLYDSVKGGVVIEGRKVYDELKKAYPATQTIVLTRNPEAQFPDALKASSLPEAIEIANQLENHPVIWIGGGQSVYEEALALADHLYLTLVHTVVEGDTFFPEWRDSFTEVLSERKSSQGDLHYSFLVLARKTN